MITLDKFEVNVLRDFVNDYYEAVSTESSSKIAIQIVGVVDFILQSKVAAAEEEERCGRLAEGD